MKHKHELYYDDKPTGIIHEGKIKTLDLSDLQRAVGPKAQLYHTRRMKWVETD